MNRVMQVVMMVSMALGIVSAQEASQPPALAPAQLNFGGSVLGGMSSSSSGERSVSFGSASASVVDNLFEGCEYLASALQQPLLEDVSLPTRPFRSIRAVDEFGWGLVFESEEAELLYLSGLCNVIGTPWTLFGLDPRGEPVQDHELAEVDVFTLQRVKAMIEAKGAAKQAGILRPEGPPGRRGRGRRRRGGRRRGGGRGGPRKMVIE